MDTFDPEPIASLADPDYKTPFVLTYPGMLLNAALGTAMTVGVIAGGIVLGNKLSKKLN